MYIPCKVTSIFGFEQHFIHFFSQKRCFSRFSTVFYHFFTLNFVKNIQNKGQPTLFKMSAAHVTIM